MPKYRRRSNWGRNRRDWKITVSAVHCHSNETIWPWYSGVAPVSWLTGRDVSRGRNHLNFSEWNKPHLHADEIAANRMGRMPPWFYLPMHPEARPRKTQIGDNQRGFCENHLIESRDAVRREQRAKTFALQQNSDGFAEVIVIVNNKNSLHGKAILVSATGAAGGRFTG
jgi:hypothetical protein